MLKEKGACVRQWRGDLQEWMQVNGQISKIFVEPDFILLTPSGSNKRRAEKAAEVLKSLTREFLA